MFTNRYVQVVMNSLLTTVLALSVASCSNDDAIQTETTHSEKHVAYVATLSTEQQSCYYQQEILLVTSTKRMHGQQPLHLQFQHVGDCLSIHVFQFLQEQLAYMDFILHNIDNA